MISPFNTFSVSHLSPLSDQPLTFRGYVIFLMKSYNFVDPLYVSDRSLLVTALVHTVYTKNIKLISAHICLTDEDERSKQIKMVVRVLFKISGLYVIAFCRLCTSSAHRLHTTRLA